MSLPDAPPESRQQLQALARRVKSLRESLRLTQEEFARRSGISVSFASLLERGERSPSYETLFTVAKALEVPVTELFRDSPTPASQDPSHGRLVDFARKAHLSRLQVDRFIAVGHAMFAVGAKAAEEERLRCEIDGCDRDVLAKGLCASHYHQDRRRRLGS